MFENVVLTLDFLTGHVKRGEDVLGTLPEVESILDTYGALGFQPVGVSGSYLFLTREQLAPSATAGIRRMPVESLADLCPLSDEAEEPIDSQRGFSRV